MRQRLVRQPLRGFFGQHQRGAIGVAAGNCGHHAGIDHPQAPHHASPSIAHTQLGVDYGLRIIDAAHARSAYGVEDGGGDVTRQTRKVVVAFLNIGNFFNGRDGRDGERAPDFYTLPTNFIRKHHNKNSSWQKVRLRGLENELESHQNSNGFELIAKALGVPRPTR